MSVSTFGIQQPRYLSSHLRPEALRPLFSKGLLFTARTLEASLGVDTLQRENSFSTLSSYFKLVKIKLTIVFHGLYFFMVNCEENKVTASSV